MAQKIKQPIEYIADIEALRIDMPEAMDLAAVTRLYEIAFEAYKDQFVQ